MKVEMFFSFDKSAFLRSLLRYGLEEVTALSSFGRASFRLRNPISEPASEPYNMATRLTEKAIFLIRMCLGAFEKPIDATYRTSRSNGRHKRLLAFDA